ncbi:hypothetical protein EcE24377A_3890 [Escherichia coli O139:H28 str. E24377A]|uniref:Uncharacterized protein n=1 Tax=Escherichia coli O139:H28 (strain E24377A / ETEC) TaxID=331111 RepID=A7ZSU4_ECO24|nr:hypothetical protein EcHS_A3612 [Escherichia coli HS]ABV16739.1 hypothetical protein EcE24377A_3890 [Escherichia coli O139:H28 str. E24377A]EGI08635.1 conserved hypothetical protein [Escherichia coli H736]OSK10598.1 hypothetical protein EANG_03633 [Escherichia coli FVEC1465]OSK23258.1 hypothetical protein EALG_03978 [Escherichia coli TA144]OSK64774.1 hypothetical protein EADG_04005 [Escherichia coli E1114]OSL16517.1 hypothetical protein ECSG_03687 [Escherichia coli B175]OSL52767.1 hypothe
MGISRGAAISLFPIGIIRVCRQKIDVTHNK